MSALFSEQRLEHLHPSRAEVGPALWGEGPTACISLRLCLQKGWASAPTLASHGDSWPRGAGGNCALGRARPRQLGLLLGGAWLPRVLEPWNSEECGGSKATRVNPTRLSAKEGLPLC